MAEDGAPSCSPKFATGHELLFSEFIDSVTFPTRVWERRRYQVDSPVSKPRSGPPSEVAPRNSRHFQRTSVSGGRVEYETRSPTGDLEGVRDSVADPSTWPA
jgi:hypothetical protein